METDAVPHIVALDRLSRGLVISFSDHSERYYSDELLYEMLGRAEEIPDSTDVAQ
jgi:hypothetical protein